MVECHQIANLKGLNFPAHMISCLTELPLYRLIIYIDGRIFWCTFLVYILSPNFIKERLIALKDFFRGRRLFAMSFFWGEGGCLLCHFLGGGGCLLCHFFGGEGVVCYVIFFRGRGLFAVIFFFLSQNFIEKLL